ncbi:Schizosaccharomyces specific protein [Schizosaccharomyces pombe]|uniref:Uncharacterized protein C4B4.12c n=1 Tax=Schizosaccharomyces pombe (strain 972 / ATCC 24843) TaxID=284812 RepID=YOKC_SCHPO|nr:uncharacterized protein SPBC4B4.12c [Schizosaccharomyces pombe]O74973.1 RecName: Full=Uncharacterized protein C4B4.12c [Schizosaccharomyces pombe 972h-]CAA19292.1 sequence orphan [Schizosaccharomyces pombe]|eukprot:NP_596429.1 uncharacterized protein SPBC4B4.12c [Schizosaccharomyces pombe]
MVSGNDQQVIEYTSVLKEFSDGVDLMELKENFLYIRTREKIEAKLIWAGEWEWKPVNETNENNLERGRQYPSANSALMENSPEFAKWFHGQLFNRLCVLGSTSSSRKDML